MCEENRRTLFFDTLELNGRWQGLFEEACVDRKSAVLIKMILGTTVLLCGLSDFTEPS